MNFYDYFQLYRPYFFQWEENFEVIAIQGGNSIIYRKYLVEIMEKISANGIPRFGTLLLAITATNSSSKDDLSFIKRLISKDRELSEEEISAFTFLNILSELPIKFKQGENRIILFQSLFYKIHNPIACKYAVILIEELKGKTAFELEKSSFDLPLNDHIIYKDFRVFHFLLKQYPDPQSIIDSLLAMPAFEQKLLLENDEENSENKNTNLIEQLIENNHTFYSASLIKHIWSGLNIPYHNILPSQQPLGGFSDLTNKGDFDKLLISEFANDDDALMSRLANNEALYINREIPPLSNNLERIIIIDVSIKNWGSPRTIAYALLLAIANHPKTDIICSAYGVGDDYKKINFSSVLDIIESLKHLDTILHSGNGLKKLIDEIKSSKNTEVIFISSSATIEHKEMQKVFLENRNFFNYWMEIDQSGNIDVYKKLQNSKKHIQHFTLPLEELWANKKTISKTSYSDSLYNSEYPILMPLLSTYKRIITSHFDNEIFCFVTNNVLLKHDNLLKNIHLKGWEYFYSDKALKLSDITEIAKKQDGTFIMLSFDKTTFKLSLLNFKTKVSKSTFFIDWQYHKNGNFLFNTDGDCFVFDDLKKAFFTINIDYKGDLQTYPALDYPKSIRVDLLKIVNSNEEKLSNYKHKNILKNVNKISIDENQLLCFNNHRLIINNFLISLRFRKNTSQVSIQAEIVEENLFVFPNGSSIRIDPVGMIILQSPQFEKYYRVTLKNSGKNKLLLVKSLNQSMNIGLSKVKKIIDEEIPYKFTNNFTYSDAKIFSDNIKKSCPDVIFEIEEQGPIRIYIPALLEKSLGIATELNFTGDKYFCSNQHINKLAMNLKEFWDIHIRSFIENILTHGA